MDTWLVFLFCIPLFLIATLPFTYNWVSSRKKYFAKLNSIGLEESDQGLIRTLEGPPEVTQFIFSPEPPTNNPGFMYTIAHAQGFLLLLNSMTSIFYYAIYKRRIRRQKQIYNQEQLKLLKQIEKSDGDCSHLKDAMTKAFSLVGRSE
jgi:hypothetical protein